MTPQLHAVHARLIAPSASAADAVRAYVVRSTIGAALTRAQRLTYFPSNPACIITWCLRGRVAWVRIGDGTVRRVGRAPVLFSGPFTQPSVTWNPGECRIFMCLLVPGALHAIAGLQPAAWVDRIVPLPPAFDDDWQRMAHAVSNEPDDDARAALVDAFVARRLAASSAAAALPLRSGAEWPYGLAARASTSGIGRGVRQVERRLERRSAVPLRDLQVLARAEALLLDPRAAQDAGRPDWRDIATDAGPADQAQMARATRRVTGSSPQALRWRIERDEAFWMYRLWT